jgi:hypothetical protein
MASTITAGTTSGTALNFSADTSGVLTVQGVAVGGTGGLGTGNASIMKNRIINGAMVIAQYGTGSTSVQTTTTYASCDRWSAFATQNSKFTIQQNAGSVTPPAGFTNYLGLTSSSAYSIAAGDYFGFRQAIEGLNFADLGWGTANAKTVTLSFQVYSSLTGTFGGVLKNSAANRSYPFSYSIPVANTWTSISITIAGDTTGTWLTTNGIGVEVAWSLGTGSTYSGTAGAWAAANYVSATGATSVVGTSGAVFYLTAVQIEVGSSATGFEYVNYQTSLANCQRYYAFDTYAMWSGNVNSGSTYYMYKSFLVTMRAIPTITYTASGASNFPNTASSTNNATIQQFTSQRVANGTGAGYFIDSVTINAEL